MATNRNGLPTLTKLVEHLCTLITRYGAAMNAAIDAAVAAGTISSADGATAKAFIAAASGACAIFKRITGY